jgi:hypothetical protein
MVAAGQARGRDVVQADLNDYEPEHPVQATTIFRAIYYARERRALLRRIACYTEKKLVFDLNPRQYRLDDVRADLRAAGFDRLDFRPFFVPQTHAPSAPVARMLRLLERSGPPARLVLRARFTYMCSAARGGGFLDERVHWLTSAPSTRTSPATGRSGADDCCRRRRPRRSGPRRALTQHTLRLLAVDRQVDLARRSRLSARLRWEG